MNANMEASQAHGDMSRVGPEDGYHCLAITWRDLTSNVGGT